MKNTIFWALHTQPILIIMLILAPTANVVVSVLYPFITLASIQYLWPRSSAKVTTLLTLLLFFMLIFCPVTSAAEPAWAA